MRLGVSLTEQGYETVGPGDCDWFLSIAQVEHELEAEAMEKRRG
jgi:hypothetical protein